MVELKDILPEALQGFYLQHSEHGRFGWGTRGRGTSNDPYFLACSNCAVGPEPIKTSEVKLPEDTVLELTKTLQEAW